MTDLVKPTLRDINQDYIILHAGRNNLRIENTERSEMRKEKKNFYSNLDTKVVIGNRTFWKTVKLFLFQKVTKHSKTNLVEGDKIISREEQIAK